MYSLLLVALALPGQNDPHARLAVRQAVLSRIGEPARPLLAAYGDDAARALYFLHDGPAFKLAGAYSSGRLGQLHPYMPELLRCIARHGQQFAGRDADCIACFIADHPAALAEKDFRGLFLAQPLELAFGLKTVEQGMAEAAATANDASFPAAMTPAALSSYLESHFSKVAAVAFGVLAAIFFWRRRQARLSSGVP